ncbi:MAG: sirohydrochlorin chelatase [Gordonia sp. (in: high G+C Gram-positive bacteria)]
MNSTLLLVAHGSRDPRFADTARRVRAAVAHRLAHVQVSLCYLDLNEPLVGDALRAVGGDTTVGGETTVGGDAVVVVPLLLAPGFHSEVDLPAVIRAQARTNVVCTEVLGSPQLTRALADRLGEAGLRPGDGIVLTAVGSTDTRAATVVRRRALELSTLTHHPVEVVFATRLGTGDIQLRNAIRRLRTGGAKRIAVSPYFLAAGLLTERVESALDRFESGAIVAGPIGAHPALIDAVVRAYTTAAPSATGFAHR